MVEADVCVPPRRQSAERDGFDRVHAERSHERLRVQVHVGRVGAIHVRRCDASSGSRHMEASIAAAVLHPPGGGSVPLQHGSDPDVLWPADPVPSTVRLVDGVAAVRTERARAGAVRAAGAARTGDSRSTGFQSAPAGAVDTTSACRSGARRCRGRFMGAH